MEPGEGKGSSGTHPGFPVLQGSHKRANGVRPAMQREAAHSPPAFVHVAGCGQRHQAGRIGRRQLRGQPFGLLVVSSADDG
jgi:hypothetical protein